MTERMPAIIGALVGGTFICAVGVGLNVLFGGDWLHVNIGYFATVVFLNNYARLRVAEAAIELSEAIRKALPR